MASSVICELCGKVAEGYIHTRVAIFVDGNREFGPEKLQVTPCGCITDFPDFMGEDDIEDCDEPVHKSQVTIRDMLNETNVLIFHDVWEEDEEWFVSGSEDEDE